MCKHCFGVQLLQNPPLWSSTEWKAAEAGPQQVLQELKLHNFTTGQEDELVEMVTTESSRHKMPKAFDADNNQVFHVPRATTHEWPGLCQILQPIVERA
jgi:hypothetical protein